MDVGAPQKMENFLGERKGTGHSTTKLGSGMRKTGPIGRQPSGFMGLSERQDERREGRSRDGGPAVTPTPCGPPGVRAVLRALVKNVREYLVYPNGRIVRRSRPLHVRFD